MTCYNRVRTTLDCLKGLFAQSLPKGFSLDVWLVDDASPDGTGMAVRAAFPQVHVINGSGGLFWSKGMRLAWDKAVEMCCTDENGGHFPEFFLWLNDDVVLKDGVIESLLNDYAKTQSVVVGTFSSDVSESDVSYGATNSRPNGEPHVADKGMNGNLVLIPRKVYEKVGPICGAYHHQYGDYDYGWQVRKCGFEYYASSRFCGVCPQQPERYRQKLKSHSILERISLLFDPKGYSLHDAFLYKYRNWGLLRAFLSVGHVVLKVTLARV